MARWHFDNVPDDLDQEMRAIATRDRVSLKAAVIQRLRTHESHMGDTRLSYEKPTKTPRTPHMAKPEREEWVRYWVECGGTREDGERGYDYCLQNGWKLSNGNAMKDWRATIRNWIASQKKKREEQHGQVSKAAARDERNKQAIIDGFRAAARERDEADRPELESGTNDGTDG